MVPSSNPEVKAFVNHTDAASRRFQFSVDMKVFQLGADNKGGKWHTTKARSVSRFDSEDSIRRTNGAGTRDGAFDGGLESPNPKDVVGG